MQPPILEAPDAPEALEAAEVDLAGAGPIDSSLFPVVATSPLDDGGRGFIWCAQMSRVLAREAPFVLIDTAGFAAADAAALHVCASWLRLNRARFSRLCRGVIAAQPEVECRLATRAQTQALFGGGTRVLVVSNLSCAASMARVLLHSSPPAGTVRDAVERCAAARAAGKRAWGVRAAPTAAAGAAAAAVGAHAGPSWRRPLAKGQS